MKTGFVSGIVVGLLAIVTPGCNTMESSSGGGMPDKSLYERLGGKPAITAVVDDFVGEAVAVKLVLVAGDAVQGEFDDLLAGDDGPDEPPTVVEFDHGPAFDKVEYFVGGCLGKRVADAEPLADRPPQARSRRRR